MAALSFRILPSGNLLITADNETRHELAECLRLHINPNYIWQDFTEAYWCNGSFKPFDAGDANPCVGLTEAPCVAESMNYTDDGAREIEGRLWWFPDYMIRDPLAELKNKGRAVFSLAA